MYCCFVFCVSTLTIYASWPGIFFCGNKMVPVQLLWVYQVTIQRYGVFLMIFPSYQLIELWIACHHNIKHVTAAAWMKKII